MATRTMILKFDDRHYDDIKKALGLRDLVITNTVDYDDVTLGKIKKVFHHMINIHDSFITNPKEFEENLAHIINRHLEGNE